jgi:hypothetical protein
VAQQLEINARHNTAFASAGVILVTTQSLTVGQAESASD